MFIVYARMENIYILLLFGIGIIVAIGVGLEISKNIEENIIYVLFWFMYIITIITFINIILVSNYYLTMKNKTGPPGQQGNQGDRGDKGDAGKCDADCRDQYCYKRLLDADNGIIPRKLRELNGGESVALNNAYIKSKVHQICASDEFKQLAPYNGAGNLVAYLEEIWKMWIETIYNSGGALYFKTIGSEEDFDWQAENPFDEIKKYDVFYWGMGRQYRPKIIDRCIASSDGKTPSPDYNDTKHEMPRSLIVASTNIYDFIQDNQRTFTSQDVGFWRAKQYTYKGQVYYPVGDIALGPSKRTVEHVAKIGNMTLPHKFNGPTRNTILVAGDVQGPINYELLWNNGGLRGNNFWIWRPIAPSGYIALGDIITPSAQMPPTGNNAPIRCVPFTSVKRIASTGISIWMSNNITQRPLANILVFHPNNTKWIDSSDNNAYNLFRCVIGYNSFIPESDINGSFYYIDPEKRLDINYETDSGNPDHHNSANRVGKGIIPTPQRDSKYSVIAYLQLKNQPVLKHIKSGVQMIGQIIDNAIGNSYTLSLDMDMKKDNKKCLAVINNTIKMESCNNDNESHYFSILLTGLKLQEGKQCKIKSKKTGNLLKFKDGVFSLQKEDELLDKEYLMFVMV